MKSGLSCVGPVEMDVPHLRISVKENAIVEGAKKILSSFRPDWDLDSVQFKIFTDGITNKLLGCFNGSQDTDVILIRVYGNKTDLLIDRKAETRNFKLLNAAGLAPRLYATFDGGLVYEYVAGDVLTVKTCRDENVSALVARTMADMHCVSNDRDANKRPVLWDKIRQFLDLVPVRFANGDKDDRFRRYFSALPGLEEEFEFLKRNLSTLDSPIVFCHNDLLLGNIIYSRKKEGVTFIDYEYADCNYQAYDIANHFNEFAGVDTVDYSLFPDKEFQLRWLRTYLERYYENNPDLKKTAKISDQEVLTLYDCVQKFTLASHYFWAIWALIQAEYSEIDFDFFNYAFIRFNEYYSRKSIIFDC